MKSHVKILAFLGQLSSNFLRNLEHLVKKLENIRDNQVPLVSILFPLVSTLIIFLFLQLNADLKL